MAGNVDYIELNSDNTNIYIDKYCNEVVGNLYLEQGNESYYKFFKTGEDYLKLINNADNMIIIGDGTSNHSYYLDQNIDNIYHRNNSGLDNIYSSVNINLSKTIGIENIILTNWSDPIKVDIDKNFGTCLLYGHPKNVMLDYAQGNAYYTTSPEGELKRYMGTCELTAYSNILKMNYDSYYLDYWYQIDEDSLAVGVEDITTEEGIVKYADQKNLCVNFNHFLYYYHGRLEDTLGAIHQLYPWTAPNDFLNQAGISFYSPTYWSEIADALKEGRGVIIKLSAQVLQGDYNYYGISNHTITLTGVLYDKSGNNVVGYYYCDSGLPYESKIRIISHETLCNVVFGSDFSDIKITNEILSKKVWSNNINGTGNKANNIIIGTDDKSYDANYVSDNTISMQGKNTLDGFGGYNIILGKTGSDILIAGFETLATKIDGQSEIIYTPNGIKTKKEDIEKIIPDLLNENDTTLFDNANAALHDVLDSSQINYLNGGTGDYVDTYVAADGNNILVDEGNGSSVDSYKFFTNQLSSGTTLISDADKVGNILVDGLILHGGHKLDDPLAPECYIDDNVAGVSYELVESSYIDPKDSDNNTDDPNENRDDSSTTSQDPIYDLFIEIDNDGCKHTIIINNYKKGDLGINLSEEEIDAVTYYGNIYEDLIVCHDYAFVSHDPLILDLSGDGITTTTVENGLYFDMDADGFAELTAWAGYGDGLLAIDLNGNGIIDNGSELFGDQTLLPNGELAQKGFEALSQYDENNDYVIDSNDSVFSNIVVLIGRTQTYSLSNLGIESISLNYNGESSRDVNGNILNLGSTFKYTDGSVHEIGSFTMQADTANTELTNSVEVPEEIQLLPDVEACGTVLSLHQAMAQDSSGELVDLVNQFINETDLELREAFVDQILLKWTNSEGATAKEHSGSYDPERYNVICEYFGREYEYTPGWNGGNNRITETAETFFAEAYKIIKENVYSSLMEQGQYKSLFDLITWDSTESKYDFSLVCDELNNQITADPTAGQELFVDFIRCAHQLNYYEREGFEDFKDYFISIDESYALTIDSAGKNVFIVDPEWYEYEDKYDGMGLNVCNENFDGTSFEDLIIGSDINDSISGQRGDDLIYGEGGNDTLYGYRGDDIIYGGDGNDFVSCWIGDDTVYGGAGSDRIYGDSGDDKLMGEGDSDTIYGGNGYDTIIGGAGNDTLEGGNGGDIYIYNIGDGNDIILDTQDEFRPIKPSHPGLQLKEDSAEYIEKYSNSFGSYSDYVAWYDSMFIDYVLDEIQYESYTEDTGDYIVFGEGIDPDNIVVSAANNFASDTLSDLIIYINGDPDGEFITVSKFFVSDKNKIEWFVFDNGTRISADDIANELITFANTTYSYGSELSETIIGNDTNQYIYTSTGDDIVYANKGYDHIYGSGGNTYVYNIGDGFDVIEHTNIQGSESKILFGEGITQDDIILEPHEQYSLIIRFSATSSDLIEIVDYFVNDQNKIDKIAFADGSEIELSEMYGRELLEGTSGDDVIDGSAVSNVGLEINGLEGNDNITGTDGNDIIDGGSGEDIMDGGDGYNIFYVDNENDQVIGYGTIRTTTSFILPTSISKVELLGDSDINIVAYNGHDTIIDNDGINVLAGGSGDDVYTISNVGDSVVEEDVVGIDTVKSKVSYTMEANIENLELIGTNTINGTGNDLNNKITGNNADNILDGAEGEDTLSGGLGDDTYVINDEDEIIENANEGTDTVQASISYTLGDNVENLVLSGEEGISGYGNELDNVITGNDADNTIFGGDGNDTILGNAGDDFIFGDSGDDNISGGEGSDYIYGDLGDDTIAGGLGDDNISGDEGNDIIEGNEGNDVLDGGEGADTLIGGLGDDTYIISDLNDTITELADEGSDTVQSSISYTTPDNVENIQLIGDEAIDATGNELDNEIIGNDADNILYGLAGNDTLDGGEGADTLYGGEGDDVLIVDNENDVVIEDLNGGLDTIQASISYTASDNVENIQLTGWENIDATGNELDNVITGNEGDNKLYGAAGSDELRGGYGNDTYIIDSPEDTIVEEANVYEEDVMTDFFGYDTVQSSITYTTPDNVENIELTGTSDIDATGNELDNYLTGNSGSNILQGLAGNDVLDGGGGLDTLIGGLGDDTYVITGNEDILVEDANSGSDTVNSSISYTLSDNFENIKLTGEDNIDATGNSVDNILVGNSGDNVLQGLAGNDTLDGAEGADTLYGGLGDDTYVIDNEGDTIIEDADSGIDTVQSSISITAVANIENIQLTGEENINATGNDLDNIITGNYGDNILDGGAGTDTLDGGEGSDVYIVNDDQDIISDSGYFGLDTIQSSITYTLPESIEAIELTGTDNINATGNDLSNVLFGNEGNNILDAGAGDDILFGKEGVDQLIGGLGDDTYVITDNEDILVEAENAGNDTVQSSISYTLTDNFENIALFGEDNIDATGSDVDNILTGNTGDNVLQGLAGNDILDGGEGVDTLIGGDGDDTYIINDENDSIVEELDSGLDTVISSVSITAADNVENVELTGEEAINATGNELDNQIIGNDADNILDGAAGIDTLIGGLGNDTYILDNSADVIVEAEGEGIDTVFSSDSYKLSDNLENIELTGYRSVNASGNDLNNTITGNLSDNILIGGAGNDVIYGGGGNDTISGGTGNDIIHSSAGSTYVFNKGDGIDVIYHTKTPGIESKIEIGGGYKYSDVTFYVVNDDVELKFKGTEDKLIIKDFYANDDNQIDKIFFKEDSTEVEVDRFFAVSEFKGTEYADEIYGNAYDNIIYGYESDDYIDAGNGNDTIYAGEGDDQIYDGYGDDIIYTGEGNDRIDLSPGNDTIYSSGGITLITSSGDGNNIVYLNDNTQDSQIVNKIWVWGYISSVNNIYNDLEIRLGEYNSEITIKNYFDENSDQHLDELVSFIEGVDTYFNSPDFIPSNYNLESIIGSNLDDEITSNTLYTKIESLSGNDVIQTTTSRNYIYGGEGNDTINASGTGNYIEGNEGNDIIVSGGNDTIFGGTGNDTITSYYGTNYHFRLGDGIDTIYHKYNFYESSTYDYEKDSSKLVFSNEVNPEDLIMEKVGDDLELSIANTEDKVILKDYYIDIQNQIKWIEFYDHYETTLTDYINNYNNKVEGSEADDSLSGTDSDDAIDTGAGNDTIIAGEGNDEVIGGEGDDYIEGNAGDDVIDSGTGNDIVIGGIGNDTITNTGSATFVFNLGDGVDTIYQTNVAGEVSVIQFGEGISSDSIIYENVNNNLEISIEGSDDKVIITNYFTNDASKVDKLIFSDGLEIDLADQLSTFNQNDVIGTDFDDVLEGNDQRNLIYGFAGNDEIYAGAGNDTIYGNEGNDTIEGMEGIDFIDSGTGNDVINGGIGNDIITNIGSATYIFNLGDGVDTIYQNNIEGEESIIQFGEGISSDSISFENVDNNLEIRINNTEDKLIITNFFSNVLNKVDKIVFSDSSEIVLTEYFKNNIIGTDSDDVLEGTDKPDIINALAGDDTIYGNEGNDIIDSGTGNDTIIGGTGNDSITNTGAATFVFNLGDGVDTIYQTNVDGEETAIHFGDGISLDDIIFTQADNNLELTINNTGDKVIIADYYLSAENRVDKLVFSNGSEALILDYVIIYENTIDGTDSDDFLEGTDLNDMINGFAGNDEIHALPGNDFLNGGTGDDILHGYDGNDILDGGEGADEMYGGGGNDTYYVDNENDIVSEGENNGIDTVITSVTRYADWHIENMELIGTDDINAFGNEFDNIIKGNSGNNLIESYDGNDTIYANEGNDEIHAGDGDDIVFAGDGNDIVHGYDGDDLLNAGSGNDEITGGGNNDTIYAGEGDDIAFGEDGDDILYGEAGNDDLSGNAGNDILYGGEGDDKLAGQEGNDILYGGIGSDEMYGEDGDDILYGQEDNDFINGNAGNDTLYGGEGDDTIYGEGGDDFIDGGAGNDFIESHDGNDTIYGGEGNDEIHAGDGDDIVFAGDGDDIVHGYDGDDLINAGSGNDEITGGGNNDTIYAGEGDDLAFGEDGDDIIYGEAGNDDLSGNAGNDILYGGEGDDKLAGQEGNDILYGGIGSDEMYGEDGDDILYGQEDNDFINGNAGNDTLYGGEGDDTIYGEGGDDFIDGGIGNDIIESHDGNDTIYGGEGNDEIHAGDGDDIVYGEDGDDEIHGYDGNDFIDGGSGNDILVADDGNDTLIGGTGIDEMYGGSGDDIYYVDNINDIVSEEENNGTDAVISNISWNLSQNVENLELTGSLNIRGYGNDLENILIGNSGDNILEAYAGNDILDGGEGEDQLIGGSGDDIYFVDNENDVVVEAENEGTDLIKSSVSVVATANIENLELIGSNNISATGNDLDNIITGNLGNNILDGAAGNDTLIGGAGDDTYIIDSLSDVIQENISEGIDTIKTSLSYTAPDNVENIILEGTGNISATGNGLNNKLTGNSGNNELQGGTGNDILEGNEGDDILNGGTGTDQLIGGAGNDKYIVDNEDDIVSEFEDQGIDTIESSVSFTASSNIENLILVGAADINATGNILDNTLQGNAGNNQLIGYAGNDNIYGDAGNDVINTGTGSDVVSGGTGNDTIISTDGLTYKFALGDGQDTITHTKTTGNEANIEFGTGVTKDNVTIEQVDNNLVVSINNTNDQIIVTDYFASESNKIDKLVFEDNTEIIIDDLFAGNTIEGTNKRDFLFGTCEDDIINAYAGDDKIFAGNGNDKVFAGKGNDFVLAGRGDDTVYGDKGKDQLFGGQGNDTLFGGNGSDYIKGELGDDKLFGDSGKDQLYGGQGDDILVGGAGKDQLYGSSGSDTYYFSAGDGKDYISENGFNFGINCNNFIAEISHSFLSCFFENNDYYLDDEPENNYESFSNKNAGNGLSFGNQRNYSLNSKTNNNCLYGFDNNDNYYFNNQNQKGYGCFWNKNSEKDTIAFAENITKEDIAIYMKGRDLDIMYGDKDIITVDNQRAKSNGIEEIKLEDGSYITSNDINHILQDLTAFAAGHDIDLCNVKDVKENQDLMNIVMNGWHS